MQHCSQQSLPGSRLQRNRSPSTQLHSYPWMPEIGHDCFNASPRKQNLCAHLIEVRPHRIVHDIFIFTGGLQVRHLNRQMVWQNSCTCNSWEPKTGCPTICLMWITHFSSYKSALNHVLTNFLYCISSYRALKSARSFILAGSCAYTAKLQNWRMVSWLRRF